MAKDKTAYDATLYAKYLGLASLMGRLLNYHQLPANEQGSVDRAYADVNAMLKSKKAGIRFNRSTSGCYTAFDHPEDDEPSEEPKS